MSDKEVFRWIDNDIDISSFYDRLGKDLRELIALAEQADRDGAEGSFIELCDGIEVYGKLHVPAVISVEEWELLCRKYYPV